MYDSVGFWKRFAATLLDIVIFLVVAKIIGLVVSDNDAREMTSSILQVFYMLLVPIFWSGYTVGKKMMGIRIVRKDGRKLGIGTMLLRYLVAGIIYGLTFGIATIVSAFMVGIRKDHRAIHDFIAGTYVSSDRP
ncbi:RDD family protein [Bacillus testis]|uniref:RDD family protein n=1 Tax=Bacillus testis TaxID=1622072 RepID=UPI00067F3D37|nr:RDD family protein [Bacillus testis]